MIDKDCFQNTKTNKKATEFAELSTYMWKD